MAPHLDYISPMVYPSGYHRGIPGFRNPVEHPFEVVRETVRLIRK
ncbi:MAG: GTP-binding protein, partial [Candidatus Rokubacteria bacterium]|nr:GTP-binding protein [Candidatus Rokubacteria bacterium]